MAAVPQAPRGASAAPASPTPSECQREPGVSGLRDRSNEREFAAVADVMGETVGSKCALWFAADPSEGGGGRSGRGKDRTSSKRPPSLRQARCSRRQRPRSGGRCCSAGCRDPRDDAQRPLQHRPPGVTKPPCPPSRYRTRTRATCILFNLPVAALSKETGTSILTINVDRKHPRYY